MMYAKFQTGVWQKATSYAWKTFSDPKIRRQFRVLSVLGRSALPNNKLKEVFRAPLRFPSDFFFIHSFIGDLSLFFIFQDPKTAVRNASDV